MANKKGYLKQKTTNGTDVLLPHTTSDVVSITVTINGTQYSNVEAAINALNTLAATGGQAATDLATHIANTSNPHSVTKSQVGLGSVDNVQQIEAPSSNGTANHILVFDGNSKKAKDGGKTIADIVNIAEGKTATYVCSTTGTNAVTAFNSQDDQVTISDFPFKDIDGNDVYWSSLNIGDIILITNEEVPDRWLVVKPQSNTAVFAKLETRKIDLTPYVQKANQSVPSSVPSLSWGSTTTVGTIQTSSGNQDIKVTMPANPNSDTGATSVEVTGTGNAVTAASYSSSNRKLTLTKGTTFLTSHQDISGKADKANITAGTYSAVTVNAQGIVTAGAYAIKVISNGGSTTDLATNGVYFEQD